MNRRKFLSLATAGSSAFAGCITELGSPGTDEETASKQKTLHVSPDGEEGASGAESSPLASIQGALERATPGDTVFVTAGHYFETVTTVRDGNPTRPITVTGPPDAVLHGERESTWAAGFVVEHNHVHLTGLTLDGLRRPAQPTDPMSYANLNYYTPYPDREEYLRGLVVKPHAVGNVRQAAVKIGKANDVEIGAFRVIGPAGIQHLYGGKEGHNGEIVYIGTAPDAFGGPGPDIPGEIDESSNYYIHHIDNTEGHEHAELVDVKAGVSDVLIEYCTDMGGAAQYVLPGADETAEAAMHIGGNEVTLRWSSIEHSHGQAVKVGSWEVAHPEEFEENVGFPLPDAVLDTGRNNSIYRNRFLDNRGMAIQYPTVGGEIAAGYGPREQDTICGNGYTGTSHGNPGESCPSKVPSGDGVGHTGGESPGTT